MDPLHGIRTDEVSRQQLSEYTRNDCFEMILINTFFHANVFENHSQWWINVAEQPCREIVANSGTMPHTNSQSRTRNWISSS